MTGLKTSYQAALGLLGAALLFALAVAPAQTRDRGPRVEVSCPELPSVARVGDKRVLVYELNVTNFHLFDLTLQRLEITAQEGGRPLRVLAGPDLVAAMSEPLGAAERYAAWQGRGHRLSVSD
jgi:hypothetical protein